MTGAFSCAVARQMRRLRQAALELVPGMRLMQMLQDAGIVSPSPAPVTLSAQRIPADASGVAAEDEQAPACPRCSEKMVVRRSRKGRTAGSEFWGCPRFPFCRGTRPTDA
jgi:restriction system protein